MEGHSALCQKSLGDSVKFHKRSSKMRVRSNREEVKQTITVLLPLIALSVTGLKPINLSWQRQRTAPLMLCSNSWVAGTNVSKVQMFLKLKLKMVVERERERELIFKIPYNTIIKTLYNQIIFEIKRIHIYFFSLSLWLYASCCRKLWATRNREVSKRKENRGQRDRERSKMKGCQKKGGNYWPFLMEMLMK